MSNVLLITGHNGVGKGSVAEIIQQELERYNYTVIREAFASPLKLNTIYIAREFMRSLPKPTGNKEGKELEDIVYSLSFMPYPMWTDRLNQSNMKEDVYRPLLQGFGELVRRVVHADYWLRLAAERVEEARATRSIVIIDDTRYLNEAEWCKEVGGLLVGVAGWNRRKQPSELAQLGLVNREVSTHPSVYGVDQCLLHASTVIGNTGNRVQLREAVRLQLFEHPCWKQWLTRIKESFEDHGS